MKFSEKIEWAIEQAGLNPKVEREFRRVLATQKKTFHLSQQQVNLLAETLIALRWWPPVQQAGQHPLVRQFVTRVHTLGGATYSGRDFAVATFEGGKRFELPVDPPKKNGKTKD